MSRIELKRVGKSIGRQTILRDLDLVIEEGDFMTLLGPSGCGKTTTLRLISGLDNPEKGMIAIDGKIVADSGSRYYAHPSKRGLNLVFQSYALWPHMTVYGNVAFGLEVQKTPKADIRPRVERALEKLKIVHLQDRYPAELSGGQQQRTAIARAIVTEPKILLLDEPLSNLDAKLRMDMRAELKRLHTELNTTIVYVTHDQVEALTLSTKVAVFFEGELVQADTPRNLYRRPADMRVADFIGNPKINFVDAVCDFAEGSLHVASVLGTMPYPADATHAGEVVMALYPEDIKLWDRPVEGGIGCVVDSVLPAGAETLTQVAAGGDTLLVVKSAGDDHFSVGDQAWITCAADKVNLYAKATGALIARSQGGR